MATSDETAFLASLKAANTEDGIDEGPNGDGAATESNNAFDEYDPAQAVPAVPSMPSFSPIAQDSSTQQTPSSALLNETMSTSTLLDVSSLAVPVVQDPSTTNKSDRQSESRSMSRATSSDTSQTMIPDQSLLGPSLIQEKGAATVGEETAQALQESSTTVPTPTVDKPAVAPISGADDPSSSVMQNGDHLNAMSPAPPSSKSMTFDGKTLADSATTAMSAAQTTAAPAPKNDTTAPPIPSLPKARLPHDTIGILEDRIKDDPRGDMDAWLSLISEYRKRGKLDEARSVYERFFAVFPAAVRVLPFHVEQPGTDIDCRQSSGFRTRKWKARHKTGMEWKEYSSGPSCKFPIYRFGHCIWITSDASTILRRTQVVTLATPYIKLMTWPFSRLALIRILANFGRIS